ncbi:MAG: hypothetical protein CMI16_09675 [Opitutaceae bacterium]|nr:hypothetical protein [Opitutaceae bacterium]|tara:strand:+ start:563 stop:823 length:261 start_codon:yes stop_codon:yes gene_type:complete
MCLFLSSAMARGVVTAADEFWLPTNEGWLCVDRRGVVLRRLSPAEDVVDIIAASASKNLEKKTSNGSSKFVIVTHPDGNMCVGFRK